MADDRGFKGEWAIERAREAQASKETRNSDGRQGEGRTEGAARSETAPAKPEAKSAPAPETQAKSAPAPESKTTSTPETSSRQQPPEPKVLDTRTDPEVYRDYPFKSAFRSRLGAFLSIMFGTPSEAQ
jgi:hypothetical protein